MREPPLFLTVHHGSGQPVRQAFEGDAVTIGRSAECDLVVADLELSRVHARIWREPDGRWLVADLDSRNGTSLNGRRLLEPAHVADGDEMSLGHAVLVIGLPGGPRSLDNVPTASAIEGRTPSPRAAEPRLVGRSPAIAQLRAAIARMAPTDKTVLVTGESGTGKELVARLLHLRSPRAAGPFVVVNCPAIAPSLFEAEMFGVEKGVATGVEARPGRFEAARGGTIFLDEIGDMDLAAQAKILRALQSRSIERVGGRAPVALDVRVIAATHHDLEGDVARGTFRADLFHRLRVLTLRVPPLRERTEDIVPLAEHFLACEGSGHALADDAAAALRARDFAGNVRELEHLIASAVVTADGPLVTAADLPAITAVAPGSRGGDATALLARIVEGRESFWDVVKEPYLRREISREQARDFVRRAHERGGGSYRGMSRLLGLESEYQKLFDFLKNHGLRVSDSSD